MMSGILEEDESHLDRAQCANDILSIDSAMMKGKFDHAEI